MSEAKFKFGDRVWHREWGVCGFIRYLPSGLNCELLSNIDSVLVSQVSNLTPYAPTPPPNTVPVRIAVAVAKDGRYFGLGSENKTAEHWAAEALAENGEGRITFIKGYAFLPEQPAEIEGVVE